MASAVCSPLTKDCGWPELTQAVRRHRRQLDGHMLTPAPHSCLPTCTCPFVVCMALRCHWQLPMADVTWMSDCWMHDMNTRIKQGNVRAEEQCLTRRIGILSLPLSPQPRHVQVATQPRMKAALPCRVQPTL